jgi:Ca2+-transporting ATPase
MQIFNEFNNRRLDNKFNIFEGIQRNKFFIVINCIMVGAQIAIVFVGGKAFSITPIGAVQWAICIVLAILCLPWAILVPLFPDAWFAKIALTVGRPVVVVYRALARGFGRIAKVFKKSKTSTDGKDFESDDDSHAPAITITGADEKTAGARAEDVEKGRA